MFQVNGANELSKKLADMGKKIGNKVLRSSMREGMKVVADSVKSKAPGSGRIASLVKIRAGRRKRNTIGIAVIVQDKGYTNYVPKFLDFGTKNEDGSTRIEAREFTKKAYAEKGEAAKVIAIRGVLDYVKEENGD